MSPKPGLAPALADTDRDGESYGFLPAVTEKLRSYVYLLIDPRDGSIFHVGTGTGDRCFQDVSEARERDGRAEHARVREVEAAGHRVRIEVLSHGLDPGTATTVRAAVVEALDISGARARRHERERGETATERGDTATERLRMGDAAVGRASVGDLNARYGARPVTIDPGHCVVLIRIPKAFRRGTDHQRYELTRGWWRAGARRERAQWAFAVDDGVVRAVYRIDGWEPARAGNRWGFRGHRDAEMEQRYLHRDVSEYLAQDSPMPMCYVNC